MKLEEIINEFAKLRPASTFLSIRNYTNEQGELANLTLGFHFSYINLLRRSIEILKEIEPSNKIGLMAKRELIASYEESLERYEARDYSVAEAHYEYFKDAQDNLIKGIKLHRLNEELHLNGLLVRKEIIVPGNYKVVNSSEKTIAKNKLRLQLPINKYRQFIIKKNKLETIRVEHISINP